MMAILDRASQLGLDIRLTADAQHIDVPSSLPNDIEEAILANRSEVLFRLAERERAEVIAKLKALSQDIDESDKDIEERKRLSNQTSDSLLDRLSVLEKVIQSYEQSGLASWYRVGWVMIRSALLNETVVVVRDEEALQNLPGGARVFPVYRFEEVEALNDCNEQAIKRAHACKEAFAGTVRR